MGSRLDALKPVWGCRESWGEPAAVAGSQSATLGGIWRCPEGSGACGAGRFEADAAVACPAVSIGRIVQPPAQPARSARAGRSVSARPPRPPERADRPRPTTRGRVAQKGTRLAHEVSQRCQETAPTLKLRYLCLRAAPTLKPLCAVRCVLSSDCGPTAQPCGTPLLIRVSAPSIVRGQHGS